MKVRLRQSGVAWQTVDDQIVCLDLSSSRYLAINETGSVLWPLLVEGVDAPSLVARLVEVFAIDESTAKEDVDAFVADLDARGLLETG